MLRLLLILRVTFIQREWLCPSSLFAFAYNKIEYFATFSYDTVIGIQTTNASVAIVSHNSR